MTNDLACDYISHTDSGLSERSEIDRRFDAILRDQKFSRGASIRVLRLPQVMQQTGLKKTKLYELQAAGSFPMRIQITPTSVGWIENEVQQWILQRVAASTPLRRK